MRLIPSAPFINSRWTAKIMSAWCGSGRARWWACSISGWKNSCTTPPASRRLWSWPWRPAARGQGVGTELLRAARRLARARGCAQIEVACNQLRADAHRFYGKAGLHNFHYKFSQSLLGDDTAENAIGK